MSSTLRNATEHTVHALTDLVGDAMHHIELPHIDLSRVGRSRRRLSPASIVAVVAVFLLIAVVAGRALRGRSTASGEGTTSTAPAEEPQTAAAAV